jgi:hypothetical protein
MKHPMARPSSARRWLWTFLGAAAFFLHLLLGNDSALVENVYSRGIFVGFRWLWDDTLGFSPVPFLYVLLAAALVWGAGIIWKQRRSRVSKLEGHGHFGGRGDTDRSFMSATHAPESSDRRPSTALQKISRGLLLAAGWAGGLVFFFYLLWGFNYNRIAFEKQLGLDVAPLDAAAVKAEAEWAAKGLSEARALIPGSAAAALGPEIIPQRLEFMIRNSLTRVLKDSGYPAPGRVRVRPLWPGGWLMRFASSGFYLPYCGEGYFAANLTPAERPFVMAHEMSHGFGITDEGSANLLGFLACRSSGDAAIRYSGLLAYWDYVFAALVRVARDDAARLAARLPEGVKADIRAEAANWDRYRGPLRTVSRAVYERYLKSQGVKEGMKSYDRFVTLLAAWKRLKAR